MSGPQISTNNSDPNTIWQNFITANGGNAPAAGTSQTIADQYASSDTSGGTYVVIADQPDSPQLDPPANGQTSYTIVYHDASGQNTEFNTDVNSDVNLQQVLSLFQAQSDFAPVSDDYNSISESNPTASEDLLGSLEDKYKAVTPPLSQEEIVTRAQTDLVTIVKNFCGENGLPYDPKSLDPDMVALAAGEALTDMQSQGTGHVTPAILTAVANTITNPAVKNSVETPVEGSTNGQLFNSLISGNPIVSALVVANMGKLASVIADPTERLVEARSMALASVSNYFSEQGLDMPKPGTADLNVGLAVTASLQQMVSAGTLTSDQMNNLVTTASFGAGVNVLLGGVIDVSESDQTSAAGAADGINTSFNYMQSSLASTSTLISSAANAIQNLPISQSDKNVLLNYLKVVEDKINDVEQALAQLQEALANQAKGTSQESIDTAKSNYTASMQELQKQIDSRNTPCWKKVLMPLITAVTALACIIAAPFSGGTSLVALAVVIAITIALTIATVALSQTGILQKGFTAMAAALSKDLGTSMPQWAKSLIMAMVLAVIIVVVVVATRGAASSAIGSLAGTIGADTATAMVTNATVTIGMQVTMASGVVNDLMSAIMLPAGASQQAIDIATAVVSVIVSVCAVAASMGAFKSITDTIGDIADSTVQTVKDAASAATDQLLDTLGVTLDTAIATVQAEGGAASASLVSSLEDIKDTITTLRMTVSGILQGGASIMGATSNILDGISDLKLADNDKEIGAIQDTIDMLQGLLKALQKVLASLLGGSSDGSDGEIADVSGDMNDLQKTFSNIIQGLTNALNSLTAETIFKPSSSA